MKYYEVKWNFFIFIFLFFIFFKKLILFLNLKHCISFAKHQNESATGIGATSISICIPPITFSAKNYGSTKRKYLLTKMIKLSLHSKNHFW